MNKCVFGGAFGIILEFQVNHCMIHPDFESTVRNETGELGSKFPPNLFLVACRSGNINVAKYFFKLKGGG